MKNKLLLFLLSTFLFCGCSEFAGDYFWTICFIAGCLGIGTFASKHFDWRVGDYVKDHPPGCALIVIIAVLVIGTILYIVGSCFNGGLL